MLLSFRTRVLRGLPFWMGSAFAVAGVGMAVSALLKRQDINLGRILLSAAAISFVWGGVSAPITAYFLRREEGVSARSIAARKMFMFSLGWSVAFASVGFALLGCSIGSKACLSASSLSTGLAVALVIGGFLSLMVLSS